MPSGGPKRNGRSAAALFAGPEKGSGHPVGEIERVRHVLLQRDVGWTAEPCAASGVERPTDSLRQHRRTEIGRSLPKLVGVRLCDRPADPILVLPDAFAELGHRVDSLLLRAVT